MMTGLIAKIGAMMSAQYYDCTTCSLPRRVLSLPLSSSAIKTTQCDTFEFHPEKY